MDDIQVFNFRGLHDVRAFPGDNDEPLLVAADLCKALALKGDPSSHLRRVAPEHKSLISTQTPGGSQKMLAVNEPGFYSLVLASRKPEALEFKHWIVTEVLPALRKHGSYSLSKVGPALVPADDPIEAMLQAALVTHRKQLQLERDVRDVQAGQLEVARAAESAEARATKAEARAADAQAELATMHAELAETQARAARAEAEALKAEVQSGMAIETLTGEHHYYALAPWASKKHGIHLSEQEAAQEALRVLKPWCAVRNIHRGTVYSGKHVSVYTYPEPLLEEWLKDYRARHGLKVVS